MGRKMKKIIVFAILFLIGTVSSNVSAQTKRAEIANPSNFRKMTVNQKIQVCRKSLLDCGRDAMVALDLVGLGGDDNFVQKEEVFYFKNGVGIYLSSILGKRSNSIDESRTRIAFTKQRNGAYKFVQVSEQFKCLSGTNRGKWTKNSCSASSNNNNSGQPPRSEVENLDDFRWLTINGRAVAVASAPCYKDLLECGRERLVLYGYEGFGGTDSGNFEEETFIFKNGNKYTGIYLVTMKDYKDDSVAGERVRIAFEKKGKYWDWQQAATQNLCSRGDLAGHWTKELCP